MGFLDILKKKDKLEEGLDVPPAPPLSLSKEEEKVVEAISEEEFPKGFEKEKAPKLEEELPPIPSFPEKVEEVPEKEEPIPTEIPKFPTPSILKNRPVHPLGITEEVKKETVKAVPKQKKPEIKETKPLFARMGAFKSVLYDISFIKAELKEISQGLGEEEDLALYGKLKTNLNDIQRKLRFVEKNLFKG